MSLATIDKQSSHARISSRTRHARACSFRLPPTKSGQDGSIVNTALIIGDVQRGITANYPLHRWWPH